MHFIFTFWSAQVKTHDNIPERAGDFNHLYLLTFQLNIKLNNSVTSLTIVTCVT